MSIRLTRKRVIGLAIFATLVVASGVAFGGIPASNGAIQGCYRTAGGANQGELRVVNAAADCRNNETSISFNQRGVAGATGPAGAIGATGPKGDTGAPGAVGPAGAKGDPGAKGDTGSPGATGAAGSIGATGDTGATGPAGATGATGATGAQGPAGAQGAGGSGAITSTTVFGISPPAQGGTFDTASATPVLDVPGWGTLAVTCYQNSTQFQYSFDAGFPLLQMFIGENGAGALGIWFDAGTRTVAGGATRHVWAVNYDTNGVTGLSAIAVTKPGVVRMTLAVRRVAGGCQVFATAQVSE
jgi:hypothetical protein